MIEAKVIEGDPGDPMVESVSVAAESDRFAWIWVNLHPQRDWPDVTYAFPPDPGSLDVHIFEDGYAETPEGGRYAIVELRMDRPWRSWNIVDQCHRNQVWIMACLDERIEPRDIYLSGRFRRQIEESRRAEEDDDR